MKEQAKSYNYLKVCSLNANRSNAAMHAAMHSITDNQSPTFDLFLVQEPWWEKINQTHTTVSFPGWQAILPKCPLRNDERPRVAAYFRQDAQLDITVTTGSPHSRNGSPTTGLGLSLEAGPSVTGV